MNPNKNPMVAFILSFIPGLGHLYLGRLIKALLYGGGFFGSLLLLVVMVAVRIHRLFGYNEIPYFFMLFVAFVIWAVNMIDMIRTLLGRPQPPLPESWGGGGSDPHGSTQTGNTSSVWGPSPASASQADDRFVTMLLSFVPGLGHFQLGLMQRGLAFLLTFFGLTIMIIFVTALTNRGEFMVFLGVLPIIWLYCMFDCVQHLNRKQRGEELIDRSIFEDYQEMREAGKKEQNAWHAAFHLPWSGTYVSRSAKARFAAHGGFPVQHLHHRRASAVAVSVSDSDSMVFQLLRCTAVYFKVRARGDQRCACRGLADQPSEVGRHRIARFGLVLFGR